MNVLMIGDIFSDAGRIAVSEILPRLCTQHNIQFVVGNGENAFGGKGITPETARELFNAGVDVITLGNHYRDQPSIDEVLKNDPRMIRPLNYGDEIPGRGTTIIETNGLKFGVLNLAGKVHMMDVVSPFAELDKIIDEMKKQTSFILVDFHAEATSEKRAMGFFLDGKVSVVAGSHTHVQTADEQILPNGTAYITDMGLTGPHDSVIGLDKEVALIRFAQFRRVEFKAAQGDARLCGLLVNIDANTGRAVSVQRINEKLSA